MAAADVPRYAPAFEFNRSLTPDAIYAPSDYNYTCGSSCNPSTGLWPASARPSLGDDRSEQNTSSSTEAGNAATDVDPQPERSNVEIPEHDQSPGR